MSAVRRDARDALVIAAGLSIAVVFVGAIVAAFGANDARRTLALPFAGVAPTAGSAWSIFATNARLLVLVLAAALLAGSPWALARGLPATGLLAALDTVLALTVALNTLLVGIALGAYGERMVAALVPHGPLEVGSFALALATYRRARHEWIAAADLLRIAAICATGLAAAAALETFPP
jgi:hypothetical protein